MNILVPQTYLYGLIGLLAIVSILVGRQLLRVRNDEINLINLEKGGAGGSNEASKLYELASVQLKKRLYPQAVSSLRKALKHISQEPDEAKALIENALGFALAAQDDFESAVKHYKSALQAKEDYPVALNNLAFAQERLKKTSEALEIYEGVLKIDPNNKTAKKQIKRLQNTKLGENLDPENNKGF